MIPVVVLFIPRDTAPEPGYLERVDQLISMARSEGAETYTPDLLETAVGEAHAAKVAVARQRTRPLLLRGYGAARFKIAEATRSSERLLEETRTAIQAAREESGRAIEDATRRLTRANAAAGTAHVGAQGRRALMGARIALDEARRNYARGAYGKALARADAVLQIGAEWESRSAERMERFRDAEALRRWQQWIDETLAWSDRENDYAIVVDKVGRLLILYHDGKELVTFPVDLGIDPVGRKLQEGDNATPEGRYRIQEVRQRGQTRYHRALLLDYPNGEDRARFQMAKEQGTVATDAGIGSLIEIHGMGGRDTDWTDGCVAVANLHMDALVDLVRVGTPVTIVGRRSQTPLPMLNRPTENAGS